MGIAGSWLWPSGACVQHLPSPPSWFPLKLAKRNILIYPWCTLFNSTASSQKRRVVDISGNLNVPTPWDVTSSCSVNGAYDTIPGWQTPHVHVGGERTSSLHCLRLSAQWLGCVATKDLSQVWEATVVVFCQCGRLLPWLSIEKDRTAHTEMGQKGAEVECSRFYLQAGCPFSAHCSRLVRPCTWYVSTPLATVFLVFHVPIAIWRSHMIYSWTKTNKNKIKHKAKPLSMRPREFLDTNCNADCSPD